MHRGRWFILLLLAFVGRTGAAVSTQIPFEFRDGLIWIDVHLDKRPEIFQFLLDSGANVSVINVGVARELRTKLGRKVTVRGVRCDTTGYWRTQFKAEANGVLLPKDFLALDLSALSGDCKRQIDGLIGLDFFDHRGIEIDFAANVIRLVDAIPANFASVALERRMCGLRTPISINGRPDQWVRLDTGCASALQWVAPEVNKTACLGRKVAVGLAPISIPQAKARVAIGEFSFEDVATGIHDKPIFAGEAGLIGNDLLRRFGKVIIDSKGGWLYLDHP